MYHDALSHERQIYHDARSHERQKRNTKTLAVEWVDFLIKLNKYGSTR